MAWFLDSNICIDCLRGKAPLVMRTLQTLEPSQVKIPALVKAELLVGAAKSAQPERNRELVDLLLAPFDIIPFDDAAAIVYGQIRSNLEQVGQRIGFNDLIIAATVIAQNGTLVSANTKEFCRIEGLDLETWTEIPFA